MGFFAFESSQWELSVVCLQIFSNFYRFLAKRGQSSGEGHSILFLIWFWWGLSKWNWTKWHQFWGLYESKWSFIQSYHCIQHFTVSSTLFCVHTYPKVSHVNMLQMYHVICSFHLKAFKLKNIMVFWGHLYNSKAWELTLMNRWR